MVKINFKFLNKDFSEEDVSRVVEFIPNVGDGVFHKDIYYKVSDRCLDLDTGKYTKVHCKEQ